MRLWTLWSTKIDKNLLCLQTLEWTGTDGIHFRHVLCIHITHFIHKCNVIKKVVTHAFIVNLEHVVIIRLYFADKEILK